MKKSYRNGKSFLVQTTSEHEKIIIENLRESDQKEGWDGWRLSKEELVHMSVEASEEVFTILHESKPIGIFGVVRTSLLSDTGMIWLLGTDDLDEVGYSLAKETRRILKYFQKKYRKLMNWVALDNEVSIRWLKANGFHIEKPEAYGVFHKPFCYFWMEGKLSVNRLEFCSKEEKI